MCAYPNPDDQETQKLRQPTRIPYVNEDKDVVEVFICENETLEAFYWNGGGLRPPLAFVWRANNPSPFEAQTSKQGKPLMGILTKYTNLRVLYYLRYCVLSQTKSPFRPSEMPHT